MPESLEKDKWHLDKRIPIVLIAAILAQGTVGVWWVSGVNSQVQVHEKRLEKLETVNEKQMDIFMHLNDRLARIEQMLLDLRGDWNKK